MKRKSGARAWLTYVVVRIAFAILQAFPVDWNLRTARSLARLWGRFLPRHRDRAIAHLTEALGDQYAPAEIRRIAQRSLESVAMFAVEAVCMPRLINRFNWLRYVQPIHHAEIIKLLLSGKGLILVTGHYGSFELMGHVLASLGFRIAAVMRPLDNIYLNRFLLATRRRHGLMLLDKKGAMNQAEDIIKGGAMLGFIGDQDAGRKGMFVDFFGRPASTYKSIGLLAMSTGRPIVVGFARRCGPVARYDIVVQRVIHSEEWQRQDDPLRWITQTFTSAIEEFVRKEPEQYLWIHRRWKSEPGRKRNPVRSRGAQHTSVGV